MLTWNLGGCPSDSASNYSKMVSADGNLLYNNDFLAIITIIGCYNYNGNIMTTNASEVVQKIPKNEKDCHKYSLCVIVSMQSQHIQ